MKHLVEALRRGEAVLVPTETVYGVAVDARNPTAIARLLALKGARADKPLPVQVPSAAHAAELAEVSPLARTLMQTYWPGPLTLVLPLLASLPEPVTCGTGTIGIRVPAHPALLELLLAFGGPLAIPSANPSGHPPPRTAAEALTSLPGLPVLDGGAAQGVPSTVLSLVGEPKVLRRGPVDFAEVADQVGIL
jgi:L-threonylcarbamoyladenylate synthase